MSISLRIATALAATFLMVGNVRAAVVITASQQDGDVVIEGAGTIDLSARLSSITSFATLSPSIGVGGRSQIISYPRFLNGPVVNPMRKELTFRTENPLGRFFDGSSSPAFASSNSGDIFGLRHAEIVGLTGEILGYRIVISVAPDYFNLDPIAFEMVFEDTTIRNLGLIPGSYTGEWGRFEDADSVTLHIVPEPTAVLLVGLGLCLVFGRRRSVFS